MTLNLFCLVTVQYKIIKGEVYVFFVKDGMDFTRQPDYEVFETSIFVKIKTKEDNLTLGVVYKSPSCNVEQTELMLNQIKLTSEKNNHPNDKLLLLGDYNFPQIDWLNENTPGGEDNTASKFLSVINDSYLTQLVDQNTHFKPGTKPSMIDLVITDNDDLIDHIDYFAPIGNSHHLVLSFEIYIDLPCPIINNTIKYLYNKGDYDAMRDEFKDMNWDVVFNDLNNVDVCMYEIEKLINISKDKHIPKKKTRSNKVKRSFNIPETLHSKIMLKRKAFKYYKKYPTPTNLDKYICIRN